MKYNNEILTSFNTTVSGEKEIYKCWSFTFGNIKEIKECDNVICISSFKSSHPKGSSFLRNYITIGYYENFEQFKNEDFYGYVPTDFFIIPVNPEGDLKLKIIRDILDKHDFKIQ